MSHTPSTEARRIEPPPSGPPVNQSADPSPTPQSLPGLHTARALESSLAPSRLPERANSEWLREERRENLQDRMWGALVFGTKSFAYGSTAIVAAVTLGQVAAIPAGLNPFEVLHSHHILSHVSTVAHMTVMFLAASAGFGLWRFRQTETVIAEKVNQMLSTHSAERTARELLKLRLHGVVEHAAQHCKQSSEPSTPDAVREAASSLCRYIGEISAGAASQTGQKMAAIPAAERARELSLLIETYTKNMAAAGLNEPPFPKYDLRALEVDLHSITTHHQTWMALHKELFELLPKLTLPQAHEKSQQLRAQLAKVAANPDRALWKSITQQAVQLETSCGELQLPDSTRTLISHAVGCIQRFPEDGPYAEMQALAAQLSPAFERISSKVLDASPGSTRYDRLRFNLHNRISLFAKRYPNSSVQASVAGLVAAVSYWVSCEESLNALFPTTTSLYENSEVGLKFFKELIPFVLQGGLAFAAGAANNRFKPHLVWASLELSRLTFSCAAPFAWVYEKGQAALSQVWEGLEERALRKRYGK